MTPCEFCGYHFDRALLGRYGCPDCETIMDEPTKPTKPGTLRQRLFRERKARLELVEVRGIFAPPSLHAAIKAEAAKLVQPASLGEPKKPLNLDSPPG